MESRAADDGMGGTDPRPVTVTLLFTDIVGSTRLLDRLGDIRAYLVSRRHFELLHRAVGDAGGRPVKTLGDGLMAVFPSAPAALACAVEMQRAVACEPGPGAGLAMRVGIHTGPAVADAGDYFGMAVVVARRLCDAAGGGQILASEAAVARAGADIAGLAAPVGTLALAGLRLPVAAAAIEWRSAAAAA
jgi:class 3 adenylate cyclase